MQTQREIQNTDLGRTREDLERLRQRYLGALSANETARKTLNALEQGDLREAIDQKLGFSDVGDATTLIALLHQRKQHEKLQTIRRHVERLSRTSAAKPNFLQIQPLENRIARLDDVKSQDTTPLDHDSVQDLTEHLERAVVRAKYQLARERQLLAEITAVRSQEDPGTRVSKSQRLRSMTAVQTELFAWIEDRLTESQEAEMELASREEVTHSAIDTDAVASAAATTRITESYQAYLDTRLRLVNISTEVTRKKSNPQQAASNATNIEPLSMDRSRTPPVLPFIEKQLLPRLQLRQDTTSLTALLDSTLKGSLEETIQTLDRLADESHLLDAYPLLSQSHKFSNIAGPLHRRTHSQIPETKDESDNIQEKIEAWTFASTSAASATETYVLEQLEQGESHLDRAESHIGELRSLIGDTSDRGSDNHAEEDIWAGDIQTERQKARQARKASRATGPWATLNGKLGLEDHVSS